MGKGTLFEKSCFKAWQVFVLIYLFFSGKKDYKTYMREASILSRNSVSELTKMFRNICKEANFARFRKVGGVGFIVEMMRLYYMSKSTI